MIKTQSMMDFYQAEIEEVFENRPEEFTSLDRRVINTLNKSVSNITRNKSRYKFAENTEMHIDEHKFCYDIKNLIKTFLDPIPEVLKSGESPEKDQSDSNNFRLFNQSYNF